MTAEDTKERILDAAERLLAERGFEATSLRALTSEAGVNLAAAHYHFGSKEAVFHTVFARRIGPINGRRLAALDALERGDQLRLEDVLEAFLRPALELARQPGGAAFMRIAGRIYSEPGDHWLPIMAQFDDVRVRFLTTLHRTLPELAPDELSWRAYFLVGLMCHTMADTQRLTFLSSGTADATDVEAALDHLVPFLAAGMRARTRERHTAASRVEP